MKSIRRKASDPQSKDRLSADIQQGNVLSLRTARNWNQLITWVSLEVRSLSELPERSTAFTHNLMSALWNPKQRVRLSHTESGLPRNRAVRWSVGAVILLNVWTGQSTSEHNEESSENSPQNQWLPSETCRGAFYTLVYVGASMGGTGPTPGRDPKRRCPRLYLAHGSLGHVSGKTTIFPSLMLLDTHLPHRWLRKLVSRRKGGRRAVWPWGHSWKPLGRLLTDRRQDGLKLLYQHSLPVRSRGILKLCEPRISHLPGASYHIIFRSLCSAPWRQWLWVQMKVTVLGNTNTGTQVNK